MDANIHEIYNLLLAGKTISMEFTDAKSAEYFRVALAKYKQRQDEILIGTGFQESRQKYSFSVQPQLPLSEEASFFPVEAPVKATMCFRDKDTQKTFAITVVVEEGEAENSV